MTWFLLTKVSGIPPLEVRVPFRHVTRLPVYYLDGSSIPCYLPVAGLQAGSVGAPPPIRGSASGAVGSHS